MHELSEALTVFLSNHPQLDGDEEFAAHFEPPDVSLNQIYDLAHALQDVILKAAEHLDTP